MASQTLSPGTMADDATVGTVAWANPDNAKTSDNTYTVANCTTLSSHRLNATNFGFSIPTGATINGILVEYEASRTKTGGTGSYFQRNRIIKNGTVGVTSPTPSGGINDTEQYYSSGSSSYLWGLTWTAEDVNSPDFGFSVWIDGSGDAPTYTFFIDHIRVTVYYTGGATTRTVATNRQWATRGMATNRLSASRNLI